MDWYLVFQAIAVLFWACFIVGMMAHSSLIAIPAIDKKYAVKSLREKDGMEEYYDQKYETRKREAWERRHGRS